MAGQGRDGNTEVGGDGATLPTSLRSRVPWAGASWAPMSPQPLAQMNQEREGFGEDITVRARGFFSTSPRPNPGPQPGPPSDHPSPHIRVQILKPVPPGSYQFLALMFCQLFAPSQALSCSRSALHPLLLWELAQAQWCREHWGWKTPHVMDCVGRRGDVGQPGRGRGEGWGSCGRLLTRTKAIPTSERRAERPFPSHLGPASAASWRRGNEEHSLPSLTRPRTQR